jgi:DNA/RNA endonuclease YhcR with UshA esterase domain
MNRTIHFSFATIVSIATIAGYISLIPNIARSQQPTSKTCNRATKEGYLFPSTTGYIKGYQVKAKTGISTVTIDNSQGNSDVFIKLFTLSSERPQTIRAFLVKQGEEFTVKNVTRGTYDVRYRNLSTCRLFRTQNFKVKEEKTSERIRSSRITLTMYGVPGGKMPHVPIQEDDF